MTGLAAGVERSLPRVAGHEIAEWTFEQLSGSVGNRAGEVLRVRERAPGRPWSAVLKVLRPAAAGSTFPVIGTIPADWGRSAEHSHYWRREALFYASELPSQLATSSVRAPRRLLVEDHGDEMWIWLEDMADELVGPWAPDRLVRAARQVAGLTAASTHAAISPGDALLPHALRAWVEDLQAANIAAAGDPHTWSHPYIGMVLPDGNLSRMRRLFEGRELLLDALAAAPQAVVHLDAHRRNVLTASGSHGECSVLIDWAYVGTGAVGEDLGSIVGMSFMLGEVESCDKREVSRSAFDAYVEGLTSIGWTGDEGQARFAGHAACALQAAMINSNLAGFSAVEPGADAVLDDLISASADYLAALNELFLWHADEAWRLLGTAFTRD